MNDYGDYRSEMAKKHMNDELLSLLPTSGMVGGSQTPVAEFLIQLQSFGVTPPDEIVVARHLAMIADEAANSPMDVPVAQDSTGPLVPRRRIAFGTLMSGFLVKALIGTAAFAAVGTGAAVAADGASPGDALYGLDRALENVGINNGHAGERIEEALALIDSGHHDRAMETVEEAIEDLADDSENASAIGALRDAVSQIAAVRSTEAEGYQVTSAFRDQVAGLVNVIATEMESGQVDGGRIADTARQFSDTARAFAQSRGSNPDDSSGDPETSPGRPESIPDNKPETPPGQANKTDQP